MIPSYLDGESLIAAAEQHSAEAIHPGYGFLSENADFAALCEQSGVVFIGPTSDAIRKMGSKTGARKIASSAGAPIVPGTDEGLTDPSEALAFARSAGFPVMLKAVAGGGGKGMRRIDRESDFEAGFRDASGEAKNAFGNGAIYVEKLIEHPRHIEIQLIGDQHGNMVHLGERECSIQRRHQKVVEECPSPLVVQHPEMRSAMGEAAIRAARAAGYHNAGTVEFLVDANRDFYFLEMNTRLQVEHPVTELVTGLDLVRLQVEIAAGGHLPFSQADIRWSGAALECRIYAEDPDNQFFPSPGKITSLSEPSGPGIRPGFRRLSRLDSADRLRTRCLRSLPCGPATEEEAIARMRRAIAEYHVGGIATNLKFFDELLDDEEMVAGRLDTHFLDGFFARLEPAAAEYEPLAKLVMDQRKPAPAAKPVNPAWRLQR